MWYNKSIVKHYQTASVYADFSLCIMPIILDILRDKSSRCFFYSLIGYQVPALKVKVCYPLSLDIVNR